MQKDLTLYLVKEAANILRCSESAIHKWVAEGKLRPVRAGNRLRFTEGELRRFLGMKR